MSSPTCCLPACLLADLHCLHPVWYMRPPTHLPPPAPLASTPLQPPPPVGCGFNDGLPSLALVRAPWLLHATKPPTPALLRPALQRVLRCRRLQLEHRLLRLLLLLLAGRQLLRQPGRHAARVCAPRECMDQRRSLRARQGGQACAGGPACSHAPCTLAWSTLNQPLPPCLSHACTTPCRFALRWARARARPILRQAARPARLKLAALCRT